MHEIMINQPDVPASHGHIPASFRTRTFGRSARAPAAAPATAAAPAIPAAVPAAVPAPVLAVPATGGAKRY